MDNKNKYPSIILNNYEYASRLVEYLSANGFQFCGYGTIQSKGENVKILKKPYDKTTNIFFDMETKKQPECGFVIRFSSAAYEKFINDGIEDKFLGSLQSINFEDIELRKPSKEIVFKALEQNICSNERIV
jgi:hypothetical protein